MILFRWRRKYCFVFRYVYILLYLFILIQSYLFISLYFAYMFKFCLYVYILLYYFVLYFVVFLCLYFVFRYSYIAFGKKYFYILLLSDIMFISQITHTHTQIYIYIYIYIYIIYIYRNPHTDFSLNHGPSRYASNRDRNPAAFTSAGYLTPELSFLSAYLKEFLRITFTYTLSVTWSAQFVRKAITQIQIRTLRSHPVCIEVIE